jgi:outer membrane protein TolC
LLFVKLSQAKKLRQILQQNQSLFEDRLHRTTDALDKGLSTSDAVSANLIAAQDVQRQINDLDRQISQYAHELNLLLGLAPQTTVALQEDIMPSELDKAEILAAISDLPRRRPDLLALEAGSKAEDQRYRAALLGQFPALNVGFTRARDSANVYSNAIGITLSLPIFNRNRGNIAIEEATREKLRDEYQQRLNASRSEIYRILDEQAINSGQLHEIDAGIAALSDAANRADKAFQARNVDLTVYANVHASLLSKQVEQINLIQAILEQRVALQALMGGELPLQKRGDSK